MLKALLDTNIIIAHVAGRKSIPLEPRDYGISTLTLFELFRLPGMTEEENDALRELISFFDVFSVSAEIASRAALLAKIRSKERPIDLLIAATALELDVPLVTKNLKDFRSISGLHMRESI